MKTTKMKKVLICLDFDPTAQKVAEVGFSLAKTMGAEIVLLHVISDPADYTLNEHVTIMGYAGHIDSAPLPLDNIDKLKKVSNEFLKKSKTHLGDENIQIIVKDGDPAISILEAAEKVNADIIVMGAHSCKLVEKIVVRSVTEKVLCNTSIPLFIVPIKQKE